MSLTYFDPAIGELQDRLPEHYASRDESSLLYLIVSVFCAQIDALNAAAEAAYADAFLSSASRDALLDQWAPLLGADGEDAPFTTDQLRAYLQAVATSDSSRDALVAQLMAILAADPDNVGTTSVSFPGDGSGIDLSDPPDGTVLSQGTGPVTELSFPTDGVGLDFPGDGSGVDFPATSWLEVVERATDYAFDVYVRSYLAFDRPAFARAVDRFRRAGLLPATVTETSIPHV